MPLRALLCVLFLTLFVPLPSFAKPTIRVIIATVVKVTDGDTLNAVDPLGAKVKVRLYGIDAPEIERRNRHTGVISKPGQPYGAESQAALADLVINRQVRLDIMAVDQYKRLVAVVMDGTRNINQEMVRHGWAWAYRQYLDRPYASQYVTAEEQARQTGKGLWAQANPQPPWEFRKRQRRGGN